jgi:hypothetical protein
MRVHQVVVVAIAALCATAAAPAKPSVTFLRVTYWKDSADAKPTSTFTLHCPRGGTLARPGAACTRLARGGPTLFAPVPKNVVCTEIYGGPQKARVVGTAGGRRIWATFTRENGCQVDRWNRLSPWLLPPGGVT